MNLRAYLGTMLARRSGVDRQLANSVNVDGVVTQESANGDSENRPFAGIRHEQLAHDSGTFERAVTCRNQILHSDFVGSCLAHATQRKSTQSMRGTALRAVSILNVADLVGDHENEFPVAHDAYQRTRHADHVRRWVRVGVDFFARPYDNRKFWHFVLCDSAKIVAVQKIVNRLRKGRVWAFLCAKSALQCEKAREQFQQLRHHLFLSARLNVYRTWVLLTSLAVTRTIEKQSDEGEQCQPAKRIVSALASAWALIIKIGNGCCDATTGHTAPSLSGESLAIVLSTAMLGNGTFGPRMGSESL